MGLDATVYCNCFEARQMKEPPPFAVPISVGLDGSLEFRSEDFDVTLALDQWLLNRACDHRNGILLHQRIGNMAQVELLRGELIREPDRFPVLLNQVLYNGMHAGDYLTLDDVSRLRSELLSLDTFVCSDARETVYIERFKGQMQELVDASLSVGKPISF